MILIIMVLDALNENNERVLANNSCKGNYKCSFCGNKLFFVSKSKNGKVEHFRHEIECEYSLKFTSYYNLFINEFHYKWTKNLIKPEYLYRYWNMELYDIMTKNKEYYIIVRHNELKSSCYEKDKNIIWILDGSKRQFDINYVKYEAKTIKYIIKSNRRYDLGLISSNHKIFIDFGKNELCEIIKINHDIIECKLIKVNDFLDLYFKDIIKESLIYEDKPIELIGKYYGFNYIENYIISYNNEVNEYNNQQLKDRDDFNNKLKSYICNYNNLIELIKINIVSLQSEYNIEYYFLYDVHFDLDFYKKVAIDYYKIQYKPKHNHFKITKIISNYIKTDFDIFISENLNKIKINKDINKNLEKDNEQIKNKISELDNINTQIKKMNLKSETKLKQYNINNFNIEGHLNLLLNKNKELNVNIKNIYNNQILQELKKNKNKYEQIEMEINNYKEKHLLLKEIIDNINKNNSDNNKLLDDKTISKKLYKNNESILTEKNNEIRNIINQLKNTKKNTNEYKILETELTTKTNLLKTFKVNMLNDTNMLEIYNDKLNEYNNIIDSYKNDLNVLDNLINNYNIDVINLDTQTEIYKTELEHNLIIIKDLQTLINNNKKYKQNLCKINEYNNKIIINEKNINDNNSQISNISYNNILEIKKESHHITSFVLKNDSQIIINKYYYVNYDNIIDFNNKYCRKICISSIGKMNNIFQSIYCIKCNNLTTRLNKEQQTYIINNIETYDITKLQYCNSCI
jgi:hypothetical protein